MRMTPPAVECTAEAMCASATNHASGPAGPSRGATCQPEPRRHLPPPGNPHQSAQQIIAFPWGCYTIQP